MTLTIEGHRSDEPAYYGGENYTTLGFSVGFRELILSRFYTGLTAGYDHVDFSRFQPESNGHRTDGYFWVRASLDHEFSAHWMASLFVIHRQDDSNISRYTYDNNMIGAQITWHY
jgi:uncharacterized protein (PEP-CTERM system associated)